MSIRFLAKVSQGWQTTSRLRPFTFPGGEHHIFMPEHTTAQALTDTTGTATDGQFTEKSLGAFITGCDANDLVLLGLWADIIRSRGERTVAYIPYFPAARADRGTPLGAKVYADIVNSFNLDEVVIFDPHSPVIVDLINNVRVVDSTRVIRSTIAGRALTAADKGYVGVIAPDKGAAERTRQVAHALHLPMFQATKTRNPDTGKLSNFEVEELPTEGRLLVVDDICDGGGTFRGLAAASGISRERLDLWVSHGVFSGHANELTESFANIWTTDSHPGARREDVGAHVTPILPFLLNP